jgi:hypothetical protein
VTESRRLSLNADDFAIEVIGDESGVFRQQFPLQEEKNVLRVGIEDLSDSKEDRCDRGRALETARYCDIIVAEKDRDVDWGRERETLSRQRERNAQLAQPDVPEVPDGEVGADLRGRHEEKCFEDEERATGIAGEFPHEEGGAFVRKNASNEEGLGGREKPNEAAVGCNLVLYQYLGLRGGRIELFDRNQNHLAEIRGGRAGAKGAVSSHDLHA